MRLFKILVIIVLVIAILFLIVVYTATEIKLSESKRLEREMYSQMNRYSVYGDPRYSYVKQPSSTYGY